MNLKILVHKINSLPPSSHKVCKWMKIYHLIQLRIVHESLIFKSHETLHAPTSYYVPVFDFTSIVFVSAVYVWKNMYC